MSFCTIDQATRFTYQDELPSCSCTSSCTSPGASSCMSSSSSSCSLSLSEAKVLLSQFKGIYVVGMDPLAKLCAQRLEETFGIAVNKVTPGSNSYKDAYCAAFFKDVAHSLIISANNVFLFPKDCVSSNTIINYHQALLPWHRGLNATMWAIWAGDSSAGLSWHKVDADIDTGGLLVQREVAITDSSNSSSLMMTLNEMAIDSLSEAILMLLCGKELIVERTVSDELHGYHGLRDFPNGGFLEPNWDKETCQRFLNAMHICKFKQVAPPKVKIEGVDHEFMRWKFKDNSLTITCNSGQELLVSF